MNKLLGFLYVMLLFLIMVGPAFAGHHHCCDCDYRQTVPEPSTMLLIGSGILGLMVYGGKKIKK